MMLRSNKPLKRLTPLRPIGRRGRQYARAIRIGDRAVKHINRCELGLNGCMGSLCLTRAHRKKRRYCDEKELTIYAMACPSCHNEAETMSHEGMFKTINEAIERRNQ